MWVMEQLRILVPLLAFVGACGLLSTSRRLAPGGGAVIPLTSGERVRLAELLNATSLVHDHLARSGDGLKPMRRADWDRLQEPAFELLRMDSFRSDVMPEQRELMYLLIEISVSSRTQLHSDDLAAIRERILRLTRPLLGRAA